MTGEVRINHAALVAQLVSEVETRLLAPLADVLDAYPVAQPRLLLRHGADLWATQLLGGDEQEAIALILRLVSALYPSDKGFAPPLAWWGTPVGRVVALRFGHPTAVSVPYTVAAAMLGVTRQAVQDLVARGKLVRHPQGGATVVSVRERLRQLTGRPTPVGVAAGTVPS